MTKFGVARVVFDPHVISGVDIQYVILEGPEGITTFPGWWRRCNRRLRGSGPARCLCRRGRRERRRRH
jgi:hypothetical protein